MPKLAWYGRNFISVPVRYCLCLTEEQYRLAMKQAGIDYPTPFVNEGSFATTHIVQPKDGRTEAVAVVCMVLPDGYRMSEYNALLVHECVHVFQEIMRQWGEDNVGDETQAYFIQTISLDLMCDLEDHFKKIKNANPHNRKRNQKGEMWCDNADEITQTALESGGYTWDDEWPIQFGLDTCGLGNALLSLGAPLPRYKRQAKLIEASYIKYLYQKGIELATRHDYTVIDTSQWLDREDRKVSCLAHARIWADTKLAAPDAGHSNLAYGMQMIYSADRSLMLRNVFGTRHLMTAQLLLEGEQSSNSTINDLKDYLRKELDHV